LVNGTEWTDTGGPAYDKSNLNRANEVLSILKHNKKNNIMRVLLI